MKSQFPSVDQITGVIDTANELVNQYITAPDEGLGIAGFKLSIVDIYETESDSEITDHYVENNTAKQDNIAIKPEMYTIKGKIAELVYTKTDKVSTLGKLAGKLTIINGYLPVVSASIKQAQNSILNAQAGGGLTNYLNASLATSVDLYQTFQKINPPRTNQAKGYNYFSALMKARQLISFDTPWGFKSNFAIKNFVFTQPEATDDVSEVKLTLKEIRKVATKLVPFDPKKYQGRTAGQISSTVDKGSIQGKAVDFNTTLQPLL